MVESANSADMPLSEVIIKKPRSRKVILLIAFLLILGAIVFGVSKYWTSKNEPSYFTMPVAKSTITDTIQATGTLEPVMKASLGFKSDQKITALNVKPGDHVKTGQILAQEDPTTLKAALQSAQSQLSQDQISLQNSTITYQSNSRTLNQQQKLFAAGAVAQSDLDQAQDAFYKSELDLASAKARLVNDQAKVDQAQSDLDGATLVAPFDGLIGEVDGQVGQINGLNSSSGSSGNTLLTIISETLQLSALVNEVDIGRIQMNQDVEFTASAYGNKIFTGKVTTINPDAKTVSNVQFYPVLITCNDPNHQLRSGMSTTVNIIVARKTDVLSVPMMAVSYAQSYVRNQRSNSSGTTPESTPNQGTQQRQSSTGAGNSGGSNYKNSQNATNAQTSPADSINSSGSSGRRGTVLILQNNQPVVKQVTLGLNDGQNYEVIQGLNEGDKVIIGSNLDAKSSTSSSTNSNNSQQQNRSQSPLGGGGGMMRIRTN